MKHIIIVSTTSDQTETVTLSTSTLPEAHITARAMYPDATKISVYPDTCYTAGVLRGALMIASRTAAHMIENGTPIDKLYTIDKELHHMTSKVMRVDDDENALVKVVYGDCSSDTREILSCAIEGLLQKRKGYKEIQKHEKAYCMMVRAQYKFAFKMVSSYISSMKASTVYEMSTEFIKDKDENIISLNSALSKILYGNEDETLDDTLSQIESAVRVLPELLTPIQCKIVKMLTLGYSQGAIATILKRSDGTIQYHVTQIRQMAVNLFESKYPDLLKYVKMEEVKKIADSKKKSPEYYREYRKNKKESKK